MTVEARIVDRDPVSTAGVRRTVPMAELTEFFSDALSKTMQVLTAQGIAPAGPPFGKYYGTPSATVDVEAGYPVSTPIEPTDAVVAGSLPGGRIVEAVHVGPYDDIGKTYEAVTRYFENAGLSQAGVMWESYLTDPDAEPDPSRWRTLISWPIDSR